MSLFKKKVKKEDKEVKKEEVESKVKVGKGIKVKKEVFKYKNTNKAIIGLIVFILAIIVLNFVSSYKLKDTVDILKLKRGVPQEGLFTEELFIRDKMLKYEYEKQGLVRLSDGTKKRSIILWEDRNKVKNKFASYYVRGGSPIYWDAVGVETPKNYSYLYNMDGELLKLDLKANQFGDMLVPGDKINIRAAYQEQVFTLPTEAEFLMQQRVGLQPQTMIERQIKLFNNVSVLDILNKKGESIFDLYYHLLSLPKAKQVEEINKEEFKDKVAPATLLLNVTPEEADMYMSIQAKSPEYLLTLLPRTGSNAITELLNEISIGIARD